MGSPPMYSMTRYGRPSSSRAAVQKARDAGVVEGGQYLAFGAEPCREVGAIRSVGQDLEGDLLLVDVVGAYRGYTVLMPPSPSMDSTA